MRKTAFSTRSDIKLLYKCSSLCNLFLFILLPLSQIFLNTIVSLRTSLCTWHLRLFDGINYSSVYREITRVPEPRLQVRLRRKPDHSARTTNSWLTSRQLQIVAMSLKIIIFVRTNFSRVKFHRVQCIASSKRQGAKHRGQQYAKYMSKLSLSIIYSTSLFVEERNLKNTPPRPFSVSTGEKLHGGHFGKRKIENERQEKLRCGGLILCSFYFSIFLSHFGMYLFDLPGEGTRAPPSLPRSQELPAIRLACSYSFGLSSFLFSSRGMLNEYATLVCIMLVGIYLFNLPEAEREEWKDHKTCGVYSLDEDEIRASFFLILLLFNFYTWGPNFVCLVHQ